MDTDGSVTSQMLIPFTLLSLIVSRDLFHAHTGVPCLILSVHYYS